MTGARSECRGGAGGSHENAMFSNLNCLLRTPAASHRRPLENIALQNDRQVFDVSFFSLSSSASFLVVCHDAVLAWSFRGLISDVLNMILVPGGCILDAFGGLVPLSNAEADPRAPERPPEVVLGPLLGVMFGPFSVQNRKHKLSTAKSAEERRSETRKSGKCNTPLFSLLF